MSLFGSIGIGPVRVGASTRGRRSGGGGSIGAFLVCLVIVGAFKFWYVVLPIVGFGLLMWAIMAIVMVDGDYRGEQARKRAAIIERAEEQHRALVLDGDERIGTYGEYPPADL